MIFCYTLQTDTCIPKEKSSAWSVLLSWSLKCFVAHAAEKLKILIEKLVFPQIFLSQHKDYVTVCTVKHFTGCITKWDHAEILSLVYFNGFL